MLLTVAFLAAATAPISETDFLAQIGSGKFLCINPEEENKTCSTIDKFVTTRDGRIVDIGEILISADQAMTLEIKSTVQFEDGAACGTMALADLDGAKIRINGTLVPKEQNAALLKPLAYRLRPMAGRKVCETLTLDDGQLFKFGRAEGIDIDLAGKPAKWILATEGYKVAPY